MCLITLTDSPEEKEIRDFLNAKTLGQEKHNCKVTFKETLPVRMDWSTRRVVDLMETILMSAGTLSPTVGIIENIEYLLISYKSHEQLTLALWIYNIVY